MRVMFAIPLLLALLAGCTRRTEIASISEIKSEPDLKVISFEQLSNFLQSQRGKVVVMDVWASWCIPCKKGFPHLVQLRHDYSVASLTCASVSVDDEKDKDSALRFLKEQGARLPNFLLDEADWQDKLDVTGIPAVLLYDRSGKMVKRFDNRDPDNQFSYADVDRMLQSMGVERSSEQSTVNSEQ